MIKVFTKILCGVVCIVFSSLSVFAQGQETLHSGDMNNNGIVNAVDLLYWGQSFGASGPERNGPTGVFTPEELEEIEKFGAVYKDSLYNIDVAYADANGDGLIDDLDVSEVFIPNYGLTHGDILSDGYKKGIANIDAPAR